MEKASSLQKYPFLDQNLQPKNASAVGKNKLTLQQRSEIINGIENQNP
jgi:hypothetical protein